jgi:hypothetical protein
MSFVGIRMPAIPPRGKRWQVNFFLPRQCWAAYDDGTASALGSCRTHHTSAAHHGRRRVTGISIRRTSTPENSVPSRAGLLLPHSQGSARVQFVTGRMAILGTMWHGLSQLCHSRTPLLQSRSRPDECAARQLGGDKRSGRSYGRFQHGACERRPHPRSLQRVAEGQWAAAQSCFANSLRTRSGA